MVSYHQLVSLSLSSVFRCLSLPIIYGSHCSRFQFSLLSRIKFELLVNFNSSLDLRQLCFPCRQKYCFLTNFVVVNPILIELLPLPPTPMSINVINHPQANHSLQLIIDLDPTPVTIGSLYNSYILLQSYHQDSFPPVQHFPTAR